MENQLKKSKYRDMDDLALSDHIEFKNYDSKGNNVEVFETEYGFLLCTAIFAWQFGIFQSSYHLK